MIIASIKWVLGEDFIDDVDRYRVNTDICSRFMASLLDDGKNDYLVMELTQTLFPLEYLGGLEVIVQYFVPFRGLPLVLDLQHFIVFGEDVDWYPLIGGLKTMLLSSHRYCVECAAKFLL